MPEQEDRFTDDSLDYIKITPPEKDA